MKTWQEFEEEILKIFEEHGFKSKRRFIFRDEIGRGEIDILAERFGIILAVDAKRYTEGWYRLSALKREAKKHAERCRRLEKVIGRKVIPVIVPLIDDRVYFHHSFIVPFVSLNDFLLNLHYYLAEFGFE
ncbi:conserved hypothetical protein [Ferroglobus placidus DSM 10642]|uniref:Restriction endonuclease type IV Mrr domain-containing protein n=1 Tax=Ferroglobus placidus (strain DSM 10642 / AEDII12DO) TaxID=589924 RepID=D3S2J3_FERPA|nr:hypothetical protein [Ferroglobus placidus]ADC64523.1 conserved hypothetical protein [Ferroglobus placidus DSM 10642]